MINVLDDDLPEFTKLQYVALPSRICQYCDVIMSAIVSQITGASTVYSTACSDAGQRKTSKLCGTGLFEGNSPVTGEFPAQRASDAENVSIWWRHHVFTKLYITDKLCFFSDGFWSGFICYQSHSTRIIIKSVHASIASSKLNDAGWLREGSIRKMQTAWCHFSMKILPYYHMTTWWRHQMETFAALPALCVGNSPITGEFPAQRPVTRSFDVFCDLCLNKRLSKQSWGWWFETPSGSVWRHYNVCTLEKRWSSLACMMVIAIEIRPDLNNKIHG